MLVTQLPWTFSGSDYAKEKRLGAGEQAANQSARQLLISIEFNRRRLASQLNGRPPEL